MTDTKLFPQYLSFTALNKITFFGVLEKYFFDGGNTQAISYRWNEKTKKTYIGLYNNIIGTHMADCPEAIEDFTEGHAEQIIQSIRDDFPHYTTGTINRFVHLFWIVYKTGFENNHYKDRIGWDYIESEEHELTEKKRKPYIHMLKKSFDIQQELRILEWFKELTQNPMSCDGRHIGLVLMFFLGLRNNEACAVTFADIKTLREHEDIHYISINKTTKLRSTETKISGKTSNAARNIPLFSFLYEFLIARKEAILKIIGNNEDIESYPLTCRGTDYSKNASSADLSEYGRTLFRDLDFASDEMERVFINDKFRSKLVDNSLPVEEEELTTYLFRRNCATHLCNLGLREDVIQYYIGHEIERPGFYRNFYTNPDILYPVYCILNEHPYYAFFNGHFRQGEKYNTLLDLVTESREFAEIRKIIFQNYLKKIKNL